MPDPDLSVIDRHKARLGPAYFAAFSDHEIHGHATLADRLSPKNPVELDIKWIEKGHVSITVVSYDYAYLFSIIAGILTGSDLNILTGDVFTYSKADPMPRRRLSKTELDAAVQARRRKIVDRFEGTIDVYFSARKWEEKLRGVFNEVFHLLENGETTDHTRVKQIVNEMVSDRLKEMPHTKSALFPVEIDVDNASGGSRLIIESQDTPGFLYALANALSMRGVSIEHVQIETTDTHVRDEIDIVDKHGCPITDERTLDQLIFSIILTKQFTRFVTTSPDPYKALARFEYICSDVIQHHAKSRKMINALSNPAMMAEISKLLGVSDYLWEDFIRVQYEKLFPILEQSAERESSYDETRITVEGLRRRIARVKSFEEKIRRLNEFKDKELYNIDLHHILNRKSVRWLSKQLTHLAEVVLTVACQTIERKLEAQYGKPTTLAGQDVSYSLIGLGKLGGEALGYASDLELMLVFSDPGSTSRIGESNQAYFERFAQELNRAIHAKSDGIFMVDFRLRPYGGDGPLATSLDEFCDYYGPSGPAHDYERLALTRLRPLCGDRNLGRRIKRLRNEFVYRHKVDPLEVWSLRKKQLDEKTLDSRPNAKFSLGALVDIEYAVQLLQVEYGDNNPKLMSPRIHKTLNELTSVGVLDERETAQLVRSYEFFRKLINALRMLRGSAKDLFLPAIDDEEYRHLARRMGYRKKRDLSSVQQLHMEFETELAAVRSFNDRHFKKLKRDPAEYRSVGDIVLSTRLNQGEAEKVMSRLGFKDPKRAVTNLRNIAQLADQKESFSRLSVLIFDYLMAKSDPDMALNNWERFCSELSDPNAHFKLILAQSKRLDMMLTIFSVSHYYSAILVQMPTVFEWMLKPDNLYKPWSKARLKTHLKKIIRKRAPEVGWENALRRFKKIHTLRIGILDYCLGMSLERVTRDISLVADVLIEHVVNHLKDELNITGKFAVFAFGKLGAEELNYSSDIDLIGVCQSADCDDVKAYAKVLSGLRDILSGYTQDGHLYRVDFRLRPFGSSGPLVSAVSDFADYYEETARFWEKQALLKLRFVAGAPSLRSKVNLVRHRVLSQSFNVEHVVSEVERLRQISIKEAGRAEGRNIKVGLGGIRDVEFMAQGLVIACNTPLERYPRSTLHQLSVLSSERQISADEAEYLESAYVFLRRVEHCLQILEDRQVHVLPNAASDMDVLARHLLGESSQGDELSKKLDNIQSKVRNIYSDSFLTKK